MTDQIARALASGLKDSDANVRSAVAKVLGRLDPMHNSALRPTFSVPRELNAPSKMPTLDVGALPAEQ